MKKPDEIGLYAYMRHAHSVDGIARTNDAAAALGICTQRAHYLVEKWRNKDWCDGVSTRCVYFDPQAPIALLKWGVL